VGRNTPTLIVEGGGNPEGAAGQGGADIDDLFSGTPTPTAELERYAGAADAAGAHGGGAPVLPADLGFGVGDVLPDAPGLGEDGRVAGIGERLDDDEMLEDVLAGVRGVANARAEDQDLMLEGDPADFIAHGELPPEAPTIPGLARGADLLPADSPPAAALDSGEGRGERRSRKASSPDGAVAVGRGRALGEAVPRPVLAADSEDDASGAPAAGPPPGEWAEGEVPSNAGGAPPEGDGAILEQEALADLILAIVERW